MIFTPYLLPGSGFKLFTVYTKNNQITQKGHTKTPSYTKSDQSFYGILSTVTAAEREQWKQNGHPVTHRVVQHMAQAKAKATDILLRDDGRCFYVRGAEHPGDLQATMIYNVEERDEVYEHLNE